MKRIKSADRSNKSHANNQTCYTVKFKLNRDDIIASECDDAPAKDTDNFNGFLKIFAEIKTATDRDECKSAKRQYKPSWSTPSLVDSAHSHYNH